MKKLLASWCIILITCTAHSQDKNFIDQPYLETTAVADTSVIPDRIFVSILLNEDDSRNKKSTEELEQQLIAKLKELNIDIETDLSLLDYNSNFKSYFLKGKNILKLKNYSLLVREALTAAKVLTELENVGISNVNIERIEYSKAEQLILDLKTKAIFKAKESGNRLTEALAQKLGRAIYVSDNSSVTSALQGKVSGIQIRGTSSLYGGRAAEPILVDFQKLKFESQVKVKFILL